MKGVRAKTRVEWIKAVLGNGCRFTVNQFKRVRRRLAEQGSIMAAQAEGPAFERVVAVNANNTAFGVVRAYREGERWFAIDELTCAVGTSIESERGAFRLATLGLAVLNLSGNQVELRAVDPRAARLVNESRCGRQVRGFGVRRVVEAILSVRNPKRTRVNVNDDRRLLAAEALHDFWEIECDDLLAGRARVRLYSTWTFEAA